MDAIDKLVGIVRRANTVEAGCASVLKFCAAETPGAFWKSPPSVSLADDVKLTASWLRAQFRDPKRPKPIRGLYLGLDTLNMEGPDGFNIEIGGTSECDPLALEGDWAWECKWYGAHHLFRGLQTLQACYSKAPDKIASFADYMLVLGYSGLVLAEALAQVRVRPPMLAVWGFHDGDLFFLGRKTPEGLERICRVL